MILGNGAKADEKEEDPGYNVKLEQTFHVHSYQGNKRVVGRTWELKPHIFTGCTYQVVKL